MLSQLHQNGAVPRPHLGRLPRGREARSAGTLPLLPVPLALGASALGTCGLCGFRSLSDKGPAIEEHHSVFPVPLASTPRGNEGVPRVEETGSSGARAESAGT